ncbi:MAG: DUF721 domain-containing protein [Acidobacteriia bacterium]|nr:DUF721 domain-containing protein [Terriglobia bacterium]
MRGPGGEITSERVACAAWGPSVGKKIAAHTRAARMVRTRLIVEVEDHIWQKQLFALTPQILGALARNLGGGMVDDLEFRIVPRRREPQRAATAAPALVADEAEGIEDPILRSIYRASRKRALA